MSVARRVYAFTTLSSLNRGALTNLPVTQLLIVESRGSDVAAASATQQNHDLLINGSGCWKTSSPIILPRLPEAEAGRELLFLSQPAAKTKARSTDPTSRKPGSISSSTYCARTSWPKPRATATKRHGVAVGQSRAEGASTAEANRLMICERRNG
ncbi:hypothetical protein K0M31_008972, partial [Melipona bicolor]